MSTTDVQGSPAQTLETKAPLKDIVFLALIAALPPLSTDMYLAAMPTIGDQWHASASHVSLSLTLWFIAFSVSLLVCGSLSDKYGRKPILTAGLCIFALASLWCSLASGVNELIAGRILQGIGAAGPSAMVMSIARDRYQGLQRKHVLAYMGIILALAPMVAPVIGAMILTLSSWRSIFLTQGLYALLGLLIVMNFTETIGQRTHEKLVLLLGRYRFLFYNRRFMLANTAMGLLITPMFGYIALAPHIYIDGYHLSEQMFSLLFGLNAFMLMLGAGACTRLTRRHSDIKLLTLCMIGCAAGGLGVLILGGIHYMAFALTMCVFTFFAGMSRPLCNHLILDQVETDIGSASSFLVFYVFVAGAASMALLTAPWKHPIAMLGVFTFSVPVLVLLIWPLLLRSLAFHASSGQGAVESVVAEG